MLREKFMIFCLFVGLFVSIFCLLLQQQITTRASNATPFDETVPGKIYTLTQKYPLFSFQHSLLHGPAEENFSKNREGTFSWFVMEARLHSQTQLSALRLSYPQNFIPAIICTIIELQLGIFFMKKIGGSSLKQIRCNEMKQINQTPKSSSSSSSQ